MAAPFSIIGIGAAAGSFEVLQQFFTQMPADRNMAFVIVQPLDPTHTSSVSDALQQETSMTVAQATDGLQVRPNHVYVMPPHTAPTLQQCRLRLVPPEPPRGGPMPIDSFLRSLAHDQNDNAIGILFSGTGRDGWLGLMLIKKQGGMTMVQSDARYAGIPHQAIETGQVDYVVSAAEMPDTLLAYVQNRAWLAEASGSPTREGEVSIPLVEMTDSVQMEAERRREQLQRTERLASLGTLAAGIAHEINNPLHAISLCAEDALSLYAEAERAGDNGLETSLQHILLEVERCRVTIRNLQRLSREETTEKWLTPLNDVVQHFMQLDDGDLSHAHPALVCELDETLPPVLINPTAIEQVLVNLVQNALDSTERDVQVILRTAFTDGYVHLWVQDNGAGIAREQLAYIFDPFYSTRRQLGRAGLGLSIVHAILADHQATIEVNSALGDGTTIEIEFNPFHHEIAANEETTGS